MDFFEFIGVQLVEPPILEVEENTSKTIAVDDDEGQLCPTKILDVPRISFFGMDIFRVARMAKDERFGFHYRGRVVELTFNTMSQDGLMVFNTPEIFVELANKLMQMRKELLDANKRIESLSERAIKYDSIKESEKIATNWGFRPVLRSTAPYSAWVDNPHCLYLSGGIWHTISNVGMLALPLTKASHLVDGWYHFDTKFTI
jgi:hypothetical protein